MALRLKTKFTLFTSLLVLAIAAIISVVYVARLTRRVISESQRDAQRVAQQIFLLARNAYSQAVQNGMAPATDSPADIRSFVQQALEQSVGLTSHVDAVLSYSPAIYEVNITDQYGIAMISSDSSLVGKPVPHRTNLDSIRLSGVVEQLRVLYGPMRVYEVTVPFDLGGQPFGEVRVSVSTALWRNDFEPDFLRLLLLAGGVVLMATVAAGFISYASLGRIEDIDRQATEILEGRPYRRRRVGGRDELGRLSTKIEQIGLQLRKVRDIFGSLQENVTRAMEGLEDGLVLFSRDGWAVLITPAAEKFLGEKPAALLGKRVHEIFPPGSALGHSLRILGDELSPVEDLEVRLDAKAGVKRASVSVQLIGDGETQMGALVTLRDLESLERIGSYFQVSERMASLGRLTAGVAHEVKNPLNSMRLWLENLKMSLPPAKAGSSEPGEEDVPRRAVRILDTEIDRLDRVVKTFLDFTRPVEMNLEEVNLAGLLEEVLVLAQPQIGQAGVEAVSEFHEKNVPVFADRQLLKQAVLNLVLNAVQAMSENSTGKAEPAAGPRKRLTVVLRQKADKAEVCVTDTGRGIPQQHHNSVFQLFFTTRPGGSGIGLATAFRIVQLHSGSIDFESAVGRGTTFRIELPLASGEGAQRVSR